MFNMSRNLKRIENLEKQLIPKRKILWISMKSSESKEELIKKYEEENGKIDYSLIKETCIMSIHPDIAGSNFQSSVNILDEPQIR